MSQDAAGKPFLYAAMIFAVVLLLPGTVFRYWRDVPGGKWVLAVGGAVVAVGVLFLLYIAILTLRSGSARHKADYEQYLESVRAADTAWSPQTDAPPEKTEP